MKCEGWNEDRMDGLMSLKDEGWNDEWKSVVVYTYFDSPRNTRIKNLIICKYFP